MRMSGKLILSNRTVNIKDTMKPCLCHEGVTVCVGHQDKLKQIADRWNNHDQLTDENARLREALNEIIKLVRHPLTMDVMDISNTTEMNNAIRILNKDTK